MVNTLNMQPLQELSTDFKSLAGFLDEAMYNDIAHEVEIDCASKRAIERMYYLRELRNAMLKVAGCDFNQ